MQPQVEGSGVRFSFCVMLYATFFEATKSGSQSCSGAVSGGSVHGVKRRREGTSLQVDVNILELVVGGGIGACSPQLLQEAIPHLPRVSLSTIEAGQTRVTQHRASPTGD